MNEFTGALAGLAVRLKRVRVAAVAATRAWVMKPGAKTGFLVAMGSAVVLAIGLSASLAHSNSLAGALVEETGKFDRATSLLGARNAEVVTLSSEVNAARMREATVAATEAEQNLRSAKLDARETAVKGAEDVVAANTISGNGTFRVGVDIQPGQYHSEGGESCYWARLNAAGDDIIDNEIGSGPAVLTVQASDGLIKTSRCAPFIKAG